MTDMITLPEDPNAPRPVFPTTGTARLRDATTADWLLDNGLTVRYNDANQDTAPVGIATRQQLSGWNFLRHDPVPPSNLTLSGRDQHVAYYDAQADAFEALANAMRRAINEAPWDEKVGAVAAEIWARMMAAAKRAKARALENETVSP